MITNGQLANQTSFNNAFVSRTVDTSLVGKLGLLNTDAASGATVANSQRELNALWSFIGGVLDQVKTYVPTWASNVFGNADDSIVAKIEAIDAGFAANGSQAFRAAKVALDNGLASATIVFSSPWVDANFIPAIVIENRIDESPIFLNYVITGRTVNGFTVLFNAPTDSANYELNYLVRKVA